MNNTLKGSLIIIGILVFGIWLSISMLNDMDRQYVEEHNKCVSDCDRAGQEFFDYKRSNIFAKSCYCLLDKNVNAIW